MKLIVPRKEFAEMATRMEHAVDVKNVTLSSIKLETKKEGIKMSATNLLLTVQGVVFCPGTEEPGSWCVPGKTLIDVVRSFSGESLILESATNTLKISSGASRYSLPTFPVENFPLCPGFNNVEFFKMSSEAFVKIFSRLCFAAGDNVSRPYQAGVMLTLERAVCTDGYVMAFLENPGLPITKPALPPAATMLRIMPYLNKDTVSIAQTHGEMHIRSGNMIVSMRLLEQHFPDISKAVPIHPYQEARLPRVPVIEALKRIKLVSADTRTIKMAFKAPNTLIISGQSHTGEGEEVFIINTTANTEMYFGIEPITKSLERFTEETVLLQVRDPKDALVIREGNYVNVIIPRLR